MPDLNYSLEERRDLVAAIRRALGDECDAVTGLRAVRTLRGIRSHPADVAARAAVADIPSDGTVPDFPSVPAPWSARDHETVVKRTRKGRTVVERKRVGVAPVTGYTAPVWNGHDDGITDAACLARTMAQREIESAHVADDHTGHTVYGARMLHHGAVSFDVLRVTQRHYGHVIDRLIGTDVTDWHEVRDVPKGLDPRRMSPVTESHAGLSGWYRNTTLDEIASPTSVYGAHTQALTPWPDRMTLKVGRSRENDPTDTRVFVVAPDGEITSHWQLVAPTDETVTRRPMERSEERRPRVIAPRHANRSLPARRFIVRPGTLVNRAAARDIIARRASDHRFVGFATVQRPIVQDRTRKGTRADRSARGKVATVKRDARTIGTVDAPDTVHALAELLANVNRGERVNLRTAGGLTAVTRAASGIYATQYTRDDGKRATYRTRSAEAMAAFVA